MPHPNNETRWWQHQAAGRFSVEGTGRLVRVEGKLNKAKYRNILDENLALSAQDLRPDWFTVTQLRQHRSGPVASKAAKLAPIFREYLSKTLNDFDLKLSGQKQF